MSIAPRWAIYCITGCFGSERGIFWASSLGTARSVAAKWGGKIWKI